MKGEFKHKVTLLADNLTRNLFTLTSSKIWFNFQDNNSI